MNSYLYRIEHPEKKKKVLSEIDKIRQKRKEKIGNIGLRVFKMVCQIPIPKF